MLFRERLLHVEIKTKQKLFISKNKIFQKTVAFYRRICYNQ